MRWRRSPSTSTGDAPPPPQAGGVDVRWDPALVGAEQATQRLDRVARSDPDQAHTKVLSGPPVPGWASNPAGTHDTSVLDPSVAGAAADPFQDTAMLSRAVTEDGRPPVVPLLSRQRAAEVGMYSGAFLVMVAVVGIAARQWEQWDSTQRLITTSLAAAALLLGGLSLRAPWRRPASEETVRAVSVMLATGVLAGGVATVLLVRIGQGSDLVGRLVVGVGLGAAMALVNAKARSAFAETALLGTLAWLGWIGLPAGPTLWLGLAGLGVAWVGLGVRYARGRRTAAVAGAGLALTAAAALAAQPGAWVARGLLLLLAAGSLWAFRSGRANYWLALGAAGACALAAGTATDALSPAPALLVGGVATMLVSGFALRGAQREAAGPAAPSAGQAGAGASAPSSRR